jgi:hypothetical protein
MGGGGGQNICTNIEASLNTYIGHNTRPPSTHTFAKNVFSNNTAGFAQIRACDLLKKEMRKQNQFEGTP